MKIEKRDLKIIKSLDNLKWGGIIDYNFYENNINIIKDKYYEMIKEDLIGFIIDEEDFNRKDKLKIINILINNFDLFLDSLGYNYNLIDRIKDYNNLDRFEILEILNDLKNFKKFRD